MLVFKHLIKSYVILLGKEEFQQFFIELQRTFINIVKKWLYNIIN